MFLMSLLKLVEHVRLGEGKHRRVQQERKQLHPNAFGYQREIGDYQSEILKLVGNLFAFDLSIRVQSASLIGATIAEL